MSGGRGYETGAGEVRIRWGVIAAAMSLMSGTALGAAPSVMSGWPVTAGAGPVLGGPGGGAVVVSEGFIGESLSSSVAAFGTNRRLRWTFDALWGCGNCDDGLTPPALRADGTYGPIGPDGDDVWGVSPIGVRVPGCTGDVLADGTCIAHEVRRTPTLTESPAIAARRGGTLVWEYARPSRTWSISHDFLVPPLTLRDASGAVYTSLGAGSEPAGTPVPQQMIALNETTGTLRWQVADARPVASFASGVLAQRSGVGLVRYAADGTVRWTNPAWSAQHVVRAYVDEARGRVYISASRLDATHYVAALNAETGADLWRTRPTDRAAVLSVGSNGLVYVSINRSGRYALRAIGPEGRGRWQWDTTMPVAGAHGLIDGTVVASTGSDVRGFGGEAGLLWRLNPRRAAVRVRSTSFRLNRTTFRTNCPAPDCRVRADVGTVLRIGVPRASRFRVTLLRLNGRRLSQRFTVNAPAGVSHVRLFAANAFAPRGRRLVEIRGVVRGRTVVRRIPVTIV